jgi:hypothetical protein
MANAQRKLLSEINFPHSNRIFTLKHYKDYGDFGYNRYYLLDKSDEALNGFYLLGDFKVKTNIEVLPMIEKTIEQYLDLVELSK